MFTNAPIGVRPQPSAARRRSPETWAAAREAYLGGESAPEVCERFDLGLSAFRQRAASEEWRRSDQADPTPRDATSHEVPAEALDDDPPLDAAQMAELTRKRARRAMLEGRAREAQSWTRIHESWRRLAADDASAARRRAEAEETPEQTFADRVRRRDRNDRLEALLRADQAARKAAQRAADDDDDDEDADDLHEVHDLHATSETKAAPGGLNRRRRRALARLEALKAKQAARAGP